MKARIQSSKVMLALAAGAGLTLLPLGLFAELNNLIVYALILGVAVFNRLDSRARGYKFSIQAGAAQASIEAEGEGVEMQRACVKILLSYLAVLNIFLSALTCTQYAYRLPFTSLHNKEEMFPASKNWIWTQNPSHGS